ncbi:adipose-secreted signaling protein isoform X3 [Ahaetulla prasina]|uniref:adipose-secreted signaling protein isoform X3 n=1 Tax=Ahaetulla prasina TaxID=499056 RepID=UPI002647A482|nr:adipose-secreted signaling protein isoform X3 [Ahaetulla prasina]
MATANKGTNPKVGGVRFSPTQTVEGSSSHVHFDEKLHDSMVMVSQEKEGDFLVKVLGTDICPAPLSNLHLKVTNIVPVSEGYRVRCEYVAHKEGVLHEEMVLRSETNHSASIKVVVQARVMDRHHGTPMLLEGVKCIGAEVEYDSEQSEWQGFD